MFILFWRQTKNRAPEQPSAIIDLVTMVPFYLAILFEDVTAGLSFLHVLQIFKILPVLWLWRLFKDPSWDKNQSEQESLLVLSRFFINALVHYFDLRRNCHHVHSSWGLSGSGRHCREFLPDFEQQ